MHEWWARTDNVTAAERPILCYWAWSRLWDQNPAEMLLAFKCVLSVKRTSLCSLGRFLNKKFRRKVYRLQASTSFRWLPKLKQIVSIQQHMSHLSGHKVNMHIIPLPKLNQNGFLWVCVWVRLTCQRSRHGSNQVPQQRMKRHKNKPESLEKMSGQRKGYKSYFWVFIWTQHTETKVTAGLKGGA